MNKIVFKDNSAQKIYEDYFKRINKNATLLSKEDKEDLMMEFNSHIYEGMQNVNNSNEVATLLLLIDQLGAPEEVIKPLVAEKKLNQAKKTFNPVHVFTALFLNVKGVIAYIVLGLLSFLFLGLIITIFTKIIYPNQTGLFFKEGKYMFFGYTKLPNIGNEILGNFYIPVVLLIVTIFYFIITLLLRLIKK
jgi:uncharacterized membrane protein